MRSMFSVFPYIDRAKVGIVIAFVNLFTMVPVNVIVRERAGPPSPTKYAINWSILASLPFALMAVGMYNSII